MPARASTRAVFAIRLSTIMSNKHWQNRFPDLESISDEEISLAILYLDPDVKPETPNVTFLVALLGVAILLVAVVLWVHLGGVRFSLARPANSLWNLRALQSACN